MRSLRKAALCATLLLFCASAQAQQGQPPASPADTDPAKLGWMQGAPPSEDRMVPKDDGS